MTNITGHLPIGTEHRWGERVRVELPVQVLSAGCAPLNGSLKNLSLSGALLRSSQELPMYALIDVRIDLPSSAEACVVRGRVSRKPANGIGVEWCEFAPSAVKELLRIHP
jgi:hypothetical protein